VPRIQVPIPYWTMLGLYLTKERETVYEKCKFNLIYLFIKQATPRKRKQCHKRNTRRGCCTLIAPYLYILRRFLWPPCAADADIIFLSRGFLSIFYLSSFFPRLFSAIAHWMSTILPHVVWPECEFRMQV